MSNLDFNDDMQSDELDNQADKHISYHYVYCLKHGWVTVMDGLDGHTVIDENWNVKFCEGLVYLCAPDFDLDIEPDWDLQDEPSQEELVLMNLAAEELLRDFEGE